jgi:acetyltransferase-like isoleucine patch superfamily enzyme
MNFIDPVCENLHPLQLNPGKILVGPESVQELLARIFAGFPKTFEWHCNFFPDSGLIKQLAGKRDFSVVTDDGREAGRAGSGKTTVKFSGVEIVYPWDLLKISEMLVSDLPYSTISGKVSSRAEVDGYILLGENSVILPGVYIEGNCVIGKNCKIGPNCYIRGCTCIGDNCHIGQAVEIKNSIIGTKTSIGHLSYLGDSVVGSGVNFGAGTIVANLRHDGKNHRSMVDGVLVDTQRRKFGCIIGDNVHTGIHTAIYPGRKLAAGSSTRPGEIVKDDL